MNIQKPETNTIPVCVQYRERIIFLSKAVDEELGNQLVATMLYLDSENKKDMTLYINCSGGDVRSLHHQSSDHARLCIMASGTSNEVPALQAWSSSLHTKEHLDNAVHMGFMQVVPCLAIFDTMKYIGSDVGTVGFGGCMGMSGFLLAVGKKVRNVLTTVLCRMAHKTIHWAHCAT